MYKLLLYLFVLPLLLSTISAQSELSLQYIEEHGDNLRNPATVIVHPSPNIGWTGFPTAPEPFGRSIGGVIGNYLYVFCGQANNSMSAAYDLTTNTWSASTPPTDPGYNCGFVIAKGELYKISGTSAVSTVEKFTPDNTGTGTWSILATGPTDIMNAQNAVAFDGVDYIYVHSSNYSTTAPASYLSRYSISGNTWSNLTPVSIIKRYPGLVYADGFLYLIGGLVLTGDDPTICAKYEIATNTWSFIAPLPEAVNFCKWTTTANDSMIFLVGSGGGYSTYPSNPKVFIYDIASNVWKYDGDTPAIRGLALGFTIPSQDKIFFGGGNEGGSSTNYQATCWTGNLGVIPVELTAFYATVNLNNITLNWTTATELNNSHFVIERNTDGKTFNKISEVAGSGTTLENNSYSFTDKNLQPGNYYYRLKQVDFNGDYSYSEIVNAVIGLPGQFELLQNYPNPFNPGTSISYMLPVGSNVSLKVYDLLGKEVATLLDEFKNAGSYEVEFDASYLTSGVYFYQLRTENFIETRKMILNK